MYTCRHCEERSDAATQKAHPEKNIEPSTNVLGCRAALAMTATEAQRSKPDALRKKPNKNRHFPNRSEPIKPANKPTRTQKTPVK
jgi:hypothetical protein